jgi:hypothetical protein
MKRLYLFVIACTLLAFVGSAAPCSICLSGDRGFFINNARMLSTGQLIFTVEHFNTRKSSGFESDHHDHGEALAKYAAPFVVQHEDEGLESQAQNIVQAVVNYGVSNRVMLLATVPYTFNRLAVDDNTETRNGFGDPEILAFVDLGTIGNSALGIQIVAGGRVPLGSDNITDAGGRRLDQHLQTGTGAWSAIWGLQANHMTGGIPLFFSANYQINGANEHDFRYGNVLRFNAAAQKALVGAVDFIGEINGRYARFDEIGNEQDPNSGGTIFYFSPGVRLRLSSFLFLRAQVQLPVVEDLNGVQDEKANFRTGLILNL